MRTAAAGWTEAVAGSGQDAAPFNVLLTCYTLFERDSAEQKLDRAFLKKWRWSHMVLVRPVLHQAACVQSVSAVHVAMR